MSGFHKPALDLIRQLGIYAIGGNEGCPCTDFEAQKVKVSVSCHKSEQTVRVYTNHMDFYGGGFGEPYALDTSGLQEIADEVLRQVDAYYDADGRYAADFKVRFCSWGDDHRPPSGAEA